MIKLKTSKRLQKDHGRKLGIKIKRTRFKKLIHDKLELND
jgi:hypothetical protein